MAEIFQILSTDSKKNHLKTNFREEVCILFEKPNNLACQKMHSYQIKTNWSRTRAYLQNMVKTHFYKKNILAENLLKEDVTYLLLLPTHYPSTHSHKKR